MRVPSEHQEAADAVCAHLVSVRGGALFLSNSDALRLLGWLDRKVPIPVILVAIERAWAQRQKKRSRLPLTLGQVNRHIGKAAPGAFNAGEVPAPPTEERGTLVPLVRLIRKRADGDPHRGQLTALADGLSGLAHGPESAQPAMVLLAQFHTDVWMDVSEPRRQGLRDAARVALGDLVHLLDEAELILLIEEAALAEVRRGYGWLSAATVQDLLSPGVAS
jgi:hypothetical protein